MAVCAVLAALLAWTGFRHSHPREQRVRVVLRYDDYSNDSPLDLERKLVELAQSCGTRITFGVIPFPRTTRQQARDAIAEPLTPAKREFLREAIRLGTVEPALHGYSHVTNGIIGGGEFAGIGPDEQNRRIREGRLRLEADTGRPIMTFIPPWHMYDRTTLRALEQQGFLTLSAALNHPCEKSATLRFLPATCGFAQVKETVREALRAGFQNASVVVLFHSYDFREYDAARGHLTFEAVSAVLRDLKSDPRVKLAGLEESVQSDPDLGPPRYRLNSLIYDAVPPVLARTGQMYVSTSDAIDLLLRTVSLDVAICLATISIAAFGAGVLPDLPQPVFRRPWILAVAVGIAILALAYSLRDGSLGWKAGCAASVFVGVAVSLSAWPFWVPTKRIAHSD